MPRKKVLPEAPTEAPSDSSAATPQVGQRPPWAMSEEEQAQVAAQAEAEAAAKPIPKEQGEVPKSKYAFGRLWEVDCPFYPGLSVVFHVGNKYGDVQQTINVVKYGVLSTDVKDDDGKGDLRRNRMMAPFYKGWPDNWTHPLTEEPLVCPNPDDLDSYKVVDQLGGRFIKWLYTDGWDRAIEEASGTDEKNS